MFLEMFFWKFVVVVVVGYFMDVIGFEGIVEFVNCSFWVEGWFVFFCEIKNDFVFFVMGDCYCEVIIWIVGWVYEGLILYVMNKGMFEYVWFDIGFDDFMRYKGFDVRLEFSVIFCCCWIWVLFCCLVNDWLRNGWVYFFCVCFLYERCVFFVEVFFEGILECVMLGIGRRCI